MAKRREETPAETPADTGADDLLDVRFDGPADRLEFREWSWVRGETARKDGEHALVPAAAFRELVPLVSNPRAPAYLEVLSGDPWAGAPHWDAAAPAAAGTGPERSPGGGFFEEVSATTPAETGDEAQEG